MSGFGASAGTSGFVVSGWIVSGVLLSGVNSSNWVSGVCGASVGTSN